MAWYRCAIRSTVCVVALCCSLAVSAALAANRSWTGAHRARAHAYKGQAGCGTPRKHARAKRHARRSSFKTHTKPRHRRGGVRCPRHRSRRHHRSVAHHPQKTRTAAAVDGSCADTELTPSAENLARIREATLCLVNHERATRGERTLTPNAHLEGAAQAHSDDMAQKDYFEHVGPAGDTPISRMRANGYIYNSNVGFAVGENIGWGTLWLATPRSIVDAWMASPEHRAIILDNRFRDTAVGVSAHPPASLAGGQPGAIYTQDFGAIITG